MFACFLRSESSSFFHCACQQMASMLLWPIEPGLMRQRVCRAKNLIRLLLEVDPWVVEHKLPGSSW